MANLTNNNTFTVLIEFAKWYNGQGITRNYVSNLKSVQKDICGYLKNYPWNVKKEGYEYEVSQFAKNAILHPTKSYDFIEAVDSLLKEGDYLYARTIVDGMSYIAEKFKKAIIAMTGTNTFNDKCSALKLFRKYLETNLSGLKVKGTYNNNTYRNAINKPMLAKIDGIVALANEIGEDKFIKLAIEQSYFFAPDIVAERMNKLIVDLDKTTPLPARKTTKNDKDAEEGYFHSEMGGNTYYIEGNIKIPITLSKDGNDFVRSLISNETGFTVGAGKNTIFQNYIISHLWGRAYDPRYYTNFWNIVLVPAWANSLLDKNGEEGSLASKLKATFMAISKKLYMAKGVNWNGLNMTEPQIPNNNDVRKDDYSIKILYKKDNKGKCTPIKTIYITLR
ncbi:hypothetical protein [Segatella sp.]|uniref:hypothetical protein n=1 Tax=Segatella sp. TaxID=2974253 RepID=UPI003AACA0A3